VVCYSLPHLAQNGVSENAGGGTDDGVAPTVMCARQRAAGEPCYVTGGFSGDQRVVGINSVGMSG
jgi:hypothetical protein